MRQTLRPADLWCALRLSGRRRTSRYVVGSAMLGMQRHYGRFSRFAASDRPTRSLPWVTLASSSGAADSQRCSHAACSWRGSPQHVQAKGSQTKGSQMTGFPTRIVCSRAIQPCWSGGVRVQDTGSRTVPFCKRDAAAYEPTRRHSFRTRHFGAKYVAASVDSVPECAYWSDRLYLSL